MFLKLNGMYGKLASVGLTATLKKDGPYTLLAPTDDAWDAMLMSLTCVTPTACFACA